MAEAPQHGRVAMVPPLLTLRGSAFARGLAQASARPDRLDAVRGAVLGRLESLQTALQRADVREFLAQQTVFLQCNDSVGYEESRGVAHGFGLTHADLLAYLHGNVIADMVVQARREADGCTAWAARAADGGAWVVKNRDYRGEHGVLQHVFAHQGGELGGRFLLCVGSLGSPGAFSSGINSDGLAVVDTQIGTRDHGVGWLRYFLMTALLRDCATVDEALAFVRAVPQAGGGTLVVGDRLGRLAAVELGHRAGAAVELGTRWVARTNHFVNPTLAAQMIAPGDDLSDSSAARLAQVSQALQAVVPDAAQARALMSSHAAVGGLCRHAQKEGSRTLSCAIYDTRECRLQLAHGHPCRAPWRTYSLSPRGAAVAAEDPPT